MAYAQSDIVREVLGELFALASGQTPNADDVTWVEQRVVSTLATLGSLNIIYLSDGESIPDAAVNPLVTYLAEVCAPKFGRPRDRAAMQMAEDQMRTLQRIGKGKGGVLELEPALLPRRRGLRIF